MPTIVAVIISGIIVGGFLLTRWANKREAERLAYWRDNVQPVQLGAMQLYARL